MWLSIIPNFGCGQIQLNLLFYLNVDEKIGSFKDQFLHPIFCLTGSRIAFRCSTALFLRSRGCIFPAR